MAIIDRTATDKILWPGDPEKPRIKYQWSLSIVSGQKDDSMYDVLFGKRDDFTDPRTSNRLLRPYSIFVDETQKLYISDPGAYRVTVIDVNTNEAFHITSAGETEFLFPVAVVAFGERIYVSDSILNKVFVLDEKGNMIGDFKGYFGRPTSLAVDRERGIIYVSDTIAHKIHKYTPDGLNVGSIGIDGSGEGEFNFPTHIWVDSEGVLYVTDSMNFRVQIFSPEGNFLGMFGTHGDSYADLDKPKGIAADSDKNIYVVDSIHDVIKIFDQTGRLLLFFGQNGENYGEFSLPSGIFIDAKNNIYVGDTYNGRVQVFKYIGDN
jgi:DNA-binding beta-propeller fold protein YncE